MPGPRARDVGPIAPPVRAELQSRATSRKASLRDVVRAQIVLLAASGVSNAAIARGVGQSENTVRKWRGRFADGRKVDALKDAQRSGRPARVTVATRCELIKVACQRPADRPTAPFRDIWTYEALSRELHRLTGVQLSRSEIGRILRTEDLRPHRVRPWLHSPDPEFRPKVRRICDLYVKPPPGATVLSIDEKTCMQALARRHPTRPAAPGRPVRFEFEYKRHGTLVLLAALDVATGKLFGQCRQHRRASDLLDFMKAVAERHDRGDVYVIWDNLNIHHGERWIRFNRRHGGRFHFVHTPIHGSWVNQVEIWFSVLQRRVLRYGDFPSRGALQERVEGFIDHWNEHEAHPFRWTFRGRFRHHPEQPLAA